ncbi:MAG: hypothetical protein HYT98_03625 [Candidatus Sungbacteria bacterium]|nr:hypothetical protein [Candidatus Sungbacteria bacterium]
MQEKNSINEIIKQIRTQEDAGAFSEGADILEEGIYYRDPSALRDKLRSRLPQRIDLALGGEADKFLSKKDADGLRSFIASLRGAIKNLRILRLELAFDPTGETIDYISSWVKREIGPDMILDLGRDLSIRGGARIIFHGKLVEKSLGTMIASWIERDREKIKESLRHAVTVRNQ